MVLTIRDVAEAAGVSTATVSRALRGLDIVDVRTRERVVRIAREMNFSVSPAASRLATGRTGTIGILTPFVGRWYFTELFAGLTDRLQVHDVDLLVHTTEPVKLDEAELQTRMRRRIDGALIVGLPRESPEVRALSAMDVPIVLLGASAPDICSVSIDDRAAARIAVEHLIAQGHERIALISGRELPTRFLPENDRLAGYLDALTAHGLPTPEEMRRVGLFTTPGGEQAMQALLAERERPTAVFCMSDEMAYGALRSAARAGVRVGGDRARGEMAFVGFDGHDLADVFDLSTMNQPVRGLGEVAAAMLMERIASAQAVGEAPGTAETAADQVVLPTELVVRRSSAGTAA